MNKEKLISILEIVIIIILFSGLTILMKKNLPFFEQLIKHSFKGAIIYSLIVILAIVIAPVSSIPLIPIMSGLFGWVFTGFITLISWTLGSIITFYIAKIFGIPIISKLIPLKKLEKLEKKIMLKDSFLTILILRTVIPVDILSYALGLFSKINILKYTLATILGVIPVIFILSYAGSVSLKMQLTIFIGVFLIIFIILLVKEILNKKTN